MINEDAILGAEEFRCISKSILSLTKELKNNFGIILKINQQSSDNISTDTLNNLFKEYCKREEIRLKKEGITIKKSKNSKQELSELKNDKSKLNNYIKYFAWQRAKGRWMEYLYYLSLLNNYDLSNYFNQILYLHSANPITITEYDRKKYIWFQKEIDSSASGFKARPDLLITNSENKIDKSSILDIIEIKCRKKLSSTDIRQEFGKAFDLGVTSYSIISYHSVKYSIIEKARKLGIELNVFALSSENRDKYVQDIMDLTVHIKNQLKENIANRSFHAKLQESINLTNKKMIT